MNSHRIREAGLRCLWAIVATMAVSASAATLQVGPSRTFKTPCQAIAVAQPGDVILIDYATYNDDSCAWSTNNLTLIGVLGPGGARPVLNCAGLTDTATTGHLAQHKGIWVPGGVNTVVENMEFENAMVSNDDGANGAGIRMQGTNLTVLNCYFHDNQDGILESNIAGSNIVIRFTEFAHNGVGDPALDEGYGQTHNLYIGHCASLLFSFNYTHDANIGHLLKSRAAVNYILYNRITGENGTGSIEVDLPNGGTSYVIGNLIQKGPNAQNDHMLEFLEEGPNSKNPGTDLYVVNNSFVNQHNNNVIFVGVGSTDMTPALLQNDIFYSPGLSGTITNQTNAILMTNLTDDPEFVSLDTFNYDLTPDSPAINAGSEPGQENGFSLEPEYEYVHPACGRQRDQHNKIDIGAYEFDGGGALLSCR